MFSVMGHDRRQQLARAGQCSVACGRGKEGTDTQFGGREAP